MNTAKQQGSAKQFIIVTGLLFIFWLVLSGHYDLKHVTIGLVSSLVIAWITRPLMQLDSTKGQGYFFAFDFPYHKYLAYWPWLLWQIFKANVEIAMVVLSPRLPINPQIVKFRKKMANPLAHLTLANSITLTPGTVTVDVQEGEEYIVHALTDNAAKGLVPDKGEGEMLIKVANVFNEGTRGKLNEHS